MSNPSLLLTPAELVELTGYRRSGEQLRELHRQGFSRARLAPMGGHVVVERAHYEAVARGVFGMKEAERRVTENGLNWTRPPPAEPNLKALEEAQTSRGRRAKP